MKKVLVALATTSLLTQAALGEINPAVHKVCIEAKDYAGCVESHNSLSRKRSSEGGNAAAKTKEIMAALYDFNKRQFIVENPSLGSWIRDNPELAKKAIEKEFRFFRDEDIETSSSGTMNAWGISEQSEMLAVICRQRGETITRHIDWQLPCLTDPNEYSTEKLNQNLYKQIVRQVERRELQEMEKEGCEVEGKKLRSTMHGNACMSDYEYMSYMQKQNEREAEESYRRHQMRQAETDRKNAERRRAMEGFAESIKTLGESLQPKGVNCFSQSYGSIVTTRCN